MTHRNNFDLMRLVAALCVVAYHVGELTQAPQFGWLVDAGGRKALEVFFVVSGYLIFQSFDRSSSAKLYWENRVRRLVPAYATVVFACVLLGALLTTLPLRDFFGFTTLKYLVSNLLFLNFLQPTLPGVFAENHYQAMNGSLWTIKIEVMFYAVVPLIVWLFRRYGMHRVAAVGYVVSMAWLGGFTMLAEQTGRGAFVELSKQMPGQLMFFLAGGLLYYHRDQVKRYGAWVGVIGAVALFTTTFFELTYLNPISTALVTIFLAVVVAPLGNPTRFGDLSYGIYVVHFPLLQTMIHFHLFDRNPWGATLLFTILMFALAIASWTFVERPFLRRKRVTATESTGEAPATTAATKTLPTGSA